MELKKPEPIGLAFGVLTNGTVPLKWMMHQINLHKALPSGLYWTYICSITDFSKDKTKNYATERKDIVNKAREANIKWLMFLDSDVFIPSDAVSRLMSHGADIVTGVYWSKRDPPAPVVFEHLGDGPLWDIKPSEKPIEIGGAGLGCTLIRMSVFDKFDQEGIPYFKVNWDYNYYGRNINVDIGEDHWFFVKAKELGFKILCDTNVLCDHYDTANDRMYPGEDVVRKISGKVLDEAGMKSVVKESETLRNVDKDKKTIIFFNDAGMNINGASLEEKPIGGSESALINMARNFKKLGWNVHVYCRCDKEGIYDGVSYRDRKNIAGDINKIVGELEKDVDVFVSSRDMLPFQKDRPPNVKATALWFHDIPDPRMYSDLWKTVKNTDYYLFISEWQKNMFLQHITNFDPPKEKMVVTRNGICMEEFNGTFEKKRRKCIYYSIPFKGLDVLMGLWPRIHEKVSDAELHVYSGMKLYEQKEHPETQQIFEYAKKIANENNIILHGVVSRLELARAIQEADVVTYPNTFQETFGIVGLEAEVCRTLLITSNRGALPEVLLPENCIFIDGDPYSKDYQDRFVEETVKALTDDNYRGKFNKTARDVDWYHVAKAWRNLFEARKPLVGQHELKDINTKEYWDDKYSSKGKTEPIVPGENARINFLLDKVEDIRLNEFGDEGIVKIADIGCGDGNILSNFRDEHYELYGADISSVAIEKAKKLIPEGNFTVINPKADWLPFSKIDVMFCVHVLEHLRNPETYINIWKSSLRKGGSLIVVVPLNDDYYPEHLEIWTLARIDKFVKGVEAKKYEIVVRKSGWKYEDGREAEEAKITLKF